MSAMLLGVLEGAKTHFHELEVLLDAYLLTPTLLFVLIPHVSF